MNLIEILLISIGLSADAFAVSICKGLSSKKINIKKCLIIGAWFGFFQGIMPTIGFFLGITFENFIVFVDHWIAFILLLMIGTNMIRESFNHEQCSSNDQVDLKSMIILSIATSIDALAVGIAYVCAYGSERAILTFVSIGIITFILSAFGVKIGNKFGNKYEKKSQFMGGFILIFLGTKILLEHLGIF